MKEKIKKFFNDQQEGLGVIEIILIIVVLIALVIIFKEKIAGLIEDIFTRITNDFKAMK